VARASTINKTAIGKAPFALVSRRSGSAETKLRDLKARLQEIADLGSAVAVLSWDQSTYMPSGGATSRARQMARLAEIVHNKRTDPAIGRLLEKLEPYTDTLPADADDACLIRVLRRDYERSIRVPTDFIARSSAASSASYIAWTAARPANDFATMRPHLELALALSQEYAGFFPGYAHIMDPLIGPDEGVTVAETRALFEKLRTALVPMVRAITAAGPTDDSCLRQHFPEAAQLAFALRIAQDFGYDLQRGRLDKTAHPFMTLFGRDDVRITTRVREDDLSDALFSTLHETGHALYELGVSHALSPPLDGGTSSGAHESQSRLWENLVARSHGFWQHAYPRLQAVFPEQLRRVPLDTFYSAINKVDRSLIRTDADEVTYNLHVMIRFDLECALLEGRLAVKDLPEAWNARYEADLGVRPPDDRNGVLQDVHWFSGGLGGSFQAYTIGNILSAQFYDAAVRALPSIPGEIKSGQFDSLHGWLTANVYTHGRKFGVDQLVKRATGKPMRIEPYISYLKTKYGALYDLSAV
jgi:carboxypeptidase Taq